jgi:hypothetical protein
MRRSDKLTLRAGYDNPIERGWVVVPAHNYQQFMATFPGGKSQLNFKSEAPFRCWP